VTSFIAGDTAALRPGMAVLVNGVRGEVVRQRRNGHVIVDFGISGLPRRDGIDPADVSVEVES
jgi:hypothetical protein